MESPPDDRLIRLAEALSLVNSQTDPEEVLRAIVEAATAAIRAQGASLLLANPRTKRLEFRVATGAKAEEVKRLSLAFGEGIAGWVALHGEPLVVHDARSDPRFKRDIAESLGFSNHALLCVPLRRRGEVVGSMEVLRPVDGEPFTSEDALYLTAFADQAALALETARRLDRLAREVRALRSALGARYTFDEILTEDPAFREVLETARRVAQSHATVLLRGESGTGKEMVAQAIHNASPRRGGPFVAVNCAAIPESLLESDLFGHEKGAFTGAVAARPGKFELAAGGTIFLDEISEMTPALQAKLLRALQEQVIERLGATDVLSVDVRVIAATNRDLETEIQAGRFREDLYYRLNVVPIHLPPLRLRSRDVTLLADRFLAVSNRAHGTKVRGFSEAARSALLAHPWPGNVRELANAVERAAILAGEGLLEVEHLGLRVGRLGRRPSASVSEGEIKPLRVAQREWRRAYLERAIASTGGNRTAAAKKLAIQRTYLSRLLQEHGVQNHTGGTQK